MTKKRFLNFFNLNSKKINSRTEAHCRDLLGPQSIRLGVREPVSEVAEQCLSAQLCQGSQPQKDVPSLPCWTPQAPPPGAFLLGPLQEPPVSSQCLPGCPRVPMDTPQHPQGTKALPATQTWFPHPVLAGGPHPMCPQIPPSCICQGLRGPPLAGRAGCTPALQGPDWGSPGAQQDPLRETKPTFPTNGPSWGRDPRRLAPTHPTRCCGLKADDCHQSCRKPAPRTLGTSVVNPLIREPWAPAWVPCRSHSRVLSTNTMCCLGEVAQAPLRERQLKGGPAEPRDAERVPVGGVLFTH